MVPLEQVENVPSEKHWEHMMQNAPPEEAKKLWQLAQECLYTTKNQDQDGWGRLIGIAQRILEDRGIPQS